MPNKTLARYAALISAFQTTCGELQCVTEWEHAETLVAQQG